MYEVFPLSNYEIDPYRGFLPATDPLTALPDRFQAWEKAVERLPKYLVSGTVRQHIANLPQLDPDDLAGEAEYQRAMLLLSYLGHAYVWGERPVADVLPACIAVPWYHVAQYLGRPPVLSYASHALYNWQRDDAGQPVRLDNIQRLTNFYGGLDEDWFVLVHIAIEGCAPPAIRALTQARKAVRQDDPVSCVDALSTIMDTMKDLVKLLARMPEKCDPYIYYRRVRPFIYGWMNNPALPDGLYYEGVKDWQDQPQKFRGETGAQSSIIPALNAGLGIQFPTDNPFYQHLLGLRLYMPPNHRAFIEDLEQEEQTTSIRQFIKDYRQHYPELAKYYDQYIQYDYQFRNLHLEYAKKFIFEQQEIESSPTDQGTGGTPFVQYLKQHCRDVLNHQLSVEPSNSQMSVYDEIANV